MQVEQFLRPRLAAMMARLCLKAVSTPRPLQQDVNAKRASDLQSMLRVASLRKFVPLQPLQGRNRMRVQR